MKGMSLKRVVILEGKKFEKERSLKRNDKVRLVYDPNCED